MSDHSHKNKESLAFQIARGFVDGIYGLNCGLRDAQTMAHALMAVREAILAAKQVSGFNWEVDGCGQEDAADAMTRLDRALENSLLEVYEDESNR